MFNIAYLPFSPCPVLLLICPILTAMPAQAVQLGPGQPRVLPQVVSVVLRIVDRRPLVVKLHLKVVLAPHRIVLHHVVLDTRVTFLHFDPSESRIGIPLASLEPADRILTTFLDGCRAPTEPLMKRPLCEQSSCEHKCSTSARTSHSNVRWFDATNKQ